MQPQAITVMTYVCIMYPRQGTREVDCDEISVGAGLPKQSHTTARWGKVGKHDRTKRSHALCVSECHHFLVTEKFVSILKRTYSETHKKRSSALLVADGWASRRPRASNRACWGCYITTTTSQETGRRGRRRVSLVCVKASCLL